ncbi:hypothetical protein SNE40_020774 [Patella caerulea]|uniref:Uncharacterized protein n=2 Tax=Patella caerulea TaxID=87958 RepID=A0AAN8J6L8_PATCE
MGSYIMLDGDDWFEVLEEVLVIPAPETVPDTVPDTVPEAVSEAVSDTTLEPEIIVVSDSDDDDEWLVSSDPFWYTPATPPSPPSTGDDNAEFIQRVRLG